MDIFFFIILRLFLILFSSPISCAYLLALALHPAYIDALQSFPGPAPLLLDDGLEGVPAVTGSLAPGIHIARGRTSPLPVVGVKLEGVKFFGCPWTKQKRKSRNFITVLDVFIG